MKNLKAIAPPKELNRVLDAMKRRKLIYVHEHGDLIMRWINELEKYTKAGQ